MRAGKAAYLRGDYEEAARQAKAALSQFVIPIGNRVPV
jgi:hypothetical protein